MLTPYPTEFPKEALSMVLDAVRGRVPDAPELVHACWDVAGFALGKTLGGGPVVAGYPALSDEEILLEALQHEAPAGVSEGLFPWGLVLSIAIKLLLKYAS